jgi:myo-inositol-1(or 4)-monophosphatase
VTTDATSARVPPGQYQDLLEAMTLVAREAGEIALRFFNAGAQTSASVEYKEGGSPVSEADLLVDRMLKERLKPLVPSAGWLSEETADISDRREKKLVFIVDPIDGTRAFIKGDRRWGISVALIEEARPILGVLHMPALSETFAAAKNLGASLNGARIGASQRSSLAGLRFAGPIRAMDGLEQQGYAIRREPRVPSLAYRLARVASGDLDAAVASTNAWDWDIAAAHLLIQESGGLLTDLDLQDPAYNGQVPRHKALTAAAPQLHGELVDAIRKIAPTS